jgi:N-glycosylase/DNA lyase
MHSKKVVSLEKEIRDIYSKVNPEIVKRVEEFKNLWRSAGDRELFVELVFCILTPASRARSAAAAIERLLKERLLFRASPEIISRRLNIVRFKNKKALYVVQARNYFFSQRESNLRKTISGLSNSSNRREWLVKNINGIGYKEASHFLRNIGIGEDITILDRHILRNLFTLGLIESVPDSISKRAYIEIEERMINFSHRIQIPINHLDFILWYRETGDIFK